MENDKPPQGSAEAKSKFLANMSDEIRKAMKNILNYSDLIKKTGLNVKQTEHIDAIHSNARKLSWIVNDMLDFSQLESGEVKLQSIDFNLEYLINDVFKKTVEQKKDRPVDTYIDIHKDVLRNLIGDPTRLRQVLVNLLSNAFKFTSEGAIGIIVSNAPGDGAGESQEVVLNIEVKDSGQGIPKEQQKSIFELSDQGELSKSWEYGGTGLGLVICKLIVEAMGGTIAAESEEGQGSAFVITLPFKKGVSLRDLKINPLARGELDGKKAIVVDDNEIARKILNKCCESIGIKPILITASPNAVLQMLDDLSDDEGTPDLILCDIMMPEMDGYEMARRIRTNDKYKNIKMIAVTSAVRIGDARNAQESGFDGFLPKPVFLDELAKIITTVLGDKRKDRTIVTRHMAEELNFKGTKVLIIEGGGPDQKLVEECLDEMGCEGELVPNGQKAIECLKERTYDLCLMDFPIFQAEGAKVVTAIKEVSLNMPVVVLLTTDGTMHRTECLGAGVDDFLVKPVDMVGLKRVIKRFGKD